MYLLKIIMYKFDIEEHGYLHSRGTHATTVIVVDHVGSKKDKLQLNSPKHSSSPNLKVEMTYV
jgi:hypothetical protein